MARFQVELRHAIATWWCALVFAGVVAGFDTADAANTSRPTGRGATHDNSVYCQNSPGQPARPAYSGTGSQNPFGGECSPGPVREPAEEEPDDACPVREASLDLQGVVRVADTADTIINDSDHKPGLWIAAGAGKWKQVRSPQHIGLRLDELTARGKAIFKAMRCHRHRMFRFTDKQRLRETIELRDQIVKLMEKRIHSHTAAFGSCIDAPPSQWEKYPEPRATLHDHSTPPPNPFASGYAVRSKPLVRAHDAVQAFRTEPSVLDCHGGVQLTVLDAAETVLGEARFNALHRARRWPHFLPQRPDGEPPLYSLAGLGVPLMDEGHDTVGSNVVRVRRIPYDRYTSIARHLRLVRYHSPSGDRNQGSRDLLTFGDWVGGIAGDIKAEDMVPGDWVYLKNVRDYERIAGGPNAGENLFYIAELEPGEVKSRVFFGVGIESFETPPRFVTEAELRKHMAEDFNRRAGDRKPFTAKAQHMKWTKLGGPTIDGRYPDEAGPFTKGPLL